MDVTLVLTHRCNLACPYCYAGEHHRREMDDATMDRALDLLFGDGARVAQLSFFGGEPFLAFEAMRRAVAGARLRARDANARLLVQVTTNGTLLREAQVRWLAACEARVAVSIDGVQEAHEITRPRASGGSSWEAVVRGLRALRDAGLDPHAAMVVTPATAPFVFRSARWLWNEGIRVVHCTPELTGHWSLAERDELREELIAVGRELLFRRLRGEAVVFEPFEPSLRRGSGRASEAGSWSPGRPRVAVGTTGHLYPCAPMVGEDRETGPEAALRIGHLIEGAEAIIARVATDGVRCGGRDACACAAYLETGDRAQLGPNRAWYERISAELGAAVAAGRAEARRHGQVLASQAFRVVVERRRDDRRGMLAVLGAGGLMLAGTVSYLVQAEPRTEWLPPPPAVDRAAPAPVVESPTTVVEPPQATSTTVLKLRIEPGMIHNAGIPREREDE